jgi:hypothetical protein
MRQATHDFITSPVSPTTRRSFLKRAAAIAATTVAGGTAGSLALPVAAEAAAPPSGVISPELLQMMDDLDEALYALLECCDDCNIRDRAVRSWEERNPRPAQLWSGDEGYSPTAQSDWHMRRQSVMIQLRLGVVKRERTELNRVFNVAARALSQFEPTNRLELLAKASAGIGTDNADGLIAKAVLRDLLRFAPRLVGVEASA